MSASGSWDLPADSDAESAWLHLVALPTSRSVLKAECG